MSVTPSPYKFPPTKVAVVLRVSDYERLHQKISGTLHYKIKIYENGNFDDIANVSISTPIESDTITIHLDATSHFYNINYGDLANMLSKNTIDLRSSVKLSIESYVNINNKKHLTGTQEQYMPVEYDGALFLQLPLDKANNSLLPILVSVHSVRKNVDHYDVHLTYSESVFNNSYVSSTQYMVYLYNSTNTLVAESNSWTTTSQSDSIVNLTVPLIHNDHNIKYVIVDTLYFFLPHVATNLKTDRITITDIKELS